VISRQRFFGVPIPLWYRLDADANPMYDDPIVPTTLPMDPSSDTPPGFEEIDRGAPGGFIGDPDVMDTWATSSLTPQIAGAWLDDPELFALVFPMAMRPQAHEIIRTWLFSTVLRSHLEHGVLPWKHAAIAGWILDPDRKKLSKSKDNAKDSPEELLAKFGADAIRYWSGSARRGVDTALDANQLKVGRRLAVKLLNASRFVLGFDGVPDPARVSEPVDRALLGALSAVVAEATAAFDAFDYARALEVTEQFFWTFCDDYVELVKARAYGEAAEAGVESARAALAVALSAVQRLLAPFLPYVTEEVWSWWQNGSVHRAPWPEAPAEAPDTADTAPLLVAAEVLGAIRRAKSAAQQSMRAEVSRLEVAGPVATLERVRADLTAAGNVRDWAISEAEELSATVSL
jgi:valyl-tRNA synthetase